MRRLLATLGMLLALALPVHAQNAGGISGSVLDESGAALPGANVTLAGPGQTQHAITGADGKYSFSNVAAGAYTVTASLTGFGTTTANVTVASAVAEVPAITMAIALRGEEVVVTASKVESALINAPATMTVMGQDVLAVTPAQNYGDLLRSVPGLNVIQMSARDINITSRQGTSTLSNSQLTLVDGRSIYLDFFGLILWDFVPSNPADIKQIEVVRGPASAVWGANALTGVVNIITKTPREAPGGSLTLTGGVFDRDAGSLAGSSQGTTFGGNFSYSGAPNDTWSYRLMAGYFDSEPYARPTGSIPASTHPLDANIHTGGGVYPAFTNQGTKQPKADLRLDQELGNGGKITYSAGYAGTEGIVHTGIGPFDLQNGSYLGYGRVAYNNGGFKLAGFVNALDGEAPNLLAVDATGRPIVLDFKTQTYDVEAGYSHIVASRHILTYGANFRRNNFDITIAPQSEDRNEIGGYFQDEIFWDKFRLSLGGRVDKFGNLEDPVFSPRVTAIFKPGRAHAIRASFNRAFRSPSTINNYLDVAIVQPVDIGTALFAGLQQGGLGALVPLIRPLIAPSQFGGLFPLTVRAAGSEVVGFDLKEESLTAYEIGYTGTFAGRTTLGISVYQNDTDDNINFIGTPRHPEFYYTASNLPPGMQALAGIPVPLAPGVSVPLSRLLFDPTLIPGRSGALFGRLPNTFVYENIGKIRQRGVELSIEHSFSREFTGFANYSWQDDPKPLDAESDPNRYPTSEIGISPQNRANLGLNYNGNRFIGALGVNYASEAFWTDVLTASTQGPTDGYTMFNATVGLKWMDGKITTSVKGTNLTNEEIQQHIFGDILKRSIVGEVRFTF